MRHYLYAENIRKRLNLRVSNKSERQYSYDEKQEALSKKENNMKTKPRHLKKTIIDIDKISFLY